MCPDTRPMSEGELAELEDWGRGMFRAARLVTEVRRLQAERDRLLTYNAELASALSRHTECSWVGCDGGCPGCQAAALLARAAVAAAEGEK